MFLRSFCNIFLFEIPNYFSFRKVLNYSEINFQRFIFSYKINNKQPVGIRYHFKLRCEVLYFFINRFFQTINDKSIKRFVSI